MLHTEIERPLAQIELQCEAMLAAVEAGEPAALEAASNVLRQAAVDFSHLLETFPQEALADKAFKSRVEKIAGLIAIQRENLIRRTVAVERALNAMVPATRESTYASAGSPYGSGGAKQSGAFKVLSA